MDSHCQHLKIKRKLKRLLTINLPRVKKLKTEKLLKMRTSAITVKFTKLMAKRLYSV